MIREPRFLPETRDLYCRRVYVIRARPELMAHLTEIGTQLDADDIASLQSPTVVMTEEAPFERDLEGWRPAIENKCKEAFLRETLEYPPLSQLEPPDGLFTDMAVLAAFFDLWLDAEEADDIVIVAGCWKTRDCCPLPPRVNNPASIEWTSCSPKSGRVMDCGTITIPVCGFTKGADVWDGDIQIPLNDPDYLFWNWLLKRWRYQSTLSYQDIPSLKEEYLNA